MNLTGLRESYYVCLLSPCRGTTLCGLHCEDGTFEMCFKMQHHVISLGGMV